MHQDIYRIYYIDYKNKLRRLYSKEEYASVNDAIKAIKITRPGAEHWDFIVMNITVQSKKIEAIWPAYAKKATIFCPEYLTQKF